MDWRIKPWPGGYLFQKGADGEERFISYFSQSTTKDQRKWDTRELEVLATIATLEYFRHYIDGQPVHHLNTDHQNITLGSAGFVVDRTGLAGGCFGCPNLRVSAEMF